MKMGSSVLHLISEMYILSLQIKPPQIRQSSFFPRKASMLPAAKANGPGREALPRQLIYRQERQTCKLQVCRVALAELGVSRASGPPWSTKTCAASSLPPLKSPDSTSTAKLALAFFQLSIPRPFPQSFCLLTTCLALCTYSSPSLHLPLSILPPFPLPLANNEMLARQSSFRPLLQHCPMPLLTMLGPFGCNVPATYAHTAAYHASLGRATIA